MQRSFVGWWDDPAGQSGLERDNNGEYLVTLNICQCILRMLGLV